MERAKAFSLNLPTIGVVEDAMTGQRMMMADVVETTVGDTHFGSKFLNSAEDIVRNIESESLIRLKNREFSIPEIINNSDDYKQFISKLAETKYLSLEEQVEQLQKAFQKVIDKTDINVPIDAKYVKKVMPEGWVDYHWPDKMGFQEGTIQGITKQTGLPERWDRFGSMYGANFSDIPESGVYTYSQRSIPYVENQSAYHSGVFNKSSYFDKIDAIADGNLEKLNLVLESEGLGSLTDFEFNDYISNYKRNIKNIQSALGGDIEYYKYGVHGKAAPWEELVGGAEQIVPPLNGMDMINLGIIN
ncbi:MULTISPECIES: hypothetical protein [Streptococcus]|uniref:hypothetical protein n=1 Tax=Streptococcus TaxID=1301 RepID=UPI0012DD6ED2|nr:MULTISPECIES: hypothetical protein [Streptococcus]QHF54396.1 hypothetical protein BZG42_03075 [Streptococcus sp. DAT741]